MAVDPKKSYNDIITWAKSTSNDIIAKKLATPRSISITNSAGTPLASGNFDGSANVTLELPATVGIDISGNAATAATATYANNIRLQQRNNNTYYPAVFVDGVATDTNYKPTVTQTSSVTVRAGATRASTSAGNSYAGIALGNNISNADASNYANARVGLLRLFGNLGKYADIRPTDGFTDNRTFLLPDKGGTVALTSDLTQTSAIEQIVTDLLAQNCVFKMIQQVSNSTTNNSNNWVFVLFKVTGALMTIPAISSKPIYSFKLGFLIHCAGSSPSGVITFTEPFTRNVACLGWGYDASGGYRKFYAGNLGGGLAFYHNGDYEGTSGRLATLTGISHGKNTMGGLIIFGI